MHRLVTGDEPSKRYQALHPEQGLRQCSAMRNGSNTSQLCDMKCSIELNVNVGFVR